MLNPNAQAWVAALRSGKYQQCKEKLTDGCGFCCLGVASVICHNPDPGWEHQLGLGPKVQQWLGLGHREGELLEGQYRFLSAMNDNGETFDEIADIIESEPAGLFTAGGAK